MFKKDDVVICISPAEGQLLIKDQEYTVLQNEFSGLIRVIGLGAAFYAHRFKLKEKPHVFKVGDTVYCNYKSLPGYNVVNCPVVVKTVSAQKSVKWGHEFIFDAPTKEQGNPTYYLGQCWTICENHFGHGTVTKDPIVAGAAPVVAGNSPPAKKRKVIN